MGRIGAHPGWHTGRGILGAGKEITQGLPTLE